MIRNYLWVIYLHFHYIIVQMHQNMINQMRKMKCNLQKQNKETAYQIFNQILVLTNLMLSSKYINNKYLWVLNFLILLQRTQFIFIIFIVIFSLTFDLVSTNEFLEKSKLETSTLKEKNDLAKDLEEEWNEETAIQEFPTNAVGEIHFINEDEGSIKPSK